MCIILTSTGEFDESSLLPQNLADPSLSRAQRLPF
jgi:hypothetical protein